MHNKDAHSDHSGTDTVDKVEIDEQIKHAGQLYVLTKALWLQNPGTAFKMKCNDQYNPAEHFENGKNKLQGQLLDILDVLPEKFHKHISKKSIQALVSLLSLMACCSDRVQVQKWYGITEVQYVYTNLS